jgi:hypothetical protein
MSCVTGHATCRGTRTRGVGEVVDDEPERGRVVNDERRDEPRDVPRHPNPRRMRSSRRRMLTVKIRQPSHEFTFSVGMSFIPYPLVLTPVV